MRTEWRWVPGFEGSYEVSNKGIIRGVCRTVRRSDGMCLTIRGRIISPSKTKQGYLRVNLNTPYGEKRYKSLLVHRIVALAFLPTEDETLEVNHKDGDKNNCAVDNLEWATRVENVQHSHDENLHPRTKPVNAQSIETGEVFTYPSIAAATRALVSNDAKHKIARAVKTNGEAFGFTWSEAAR